MYPIPAIPPCKYKDLCFRSMTFVSGFLRFHRIVYEPGQQASIGFTTYMPFMRYNDLYRPGFSTVFNLFFDMYPLLEVRTIANNKCHDTVSRWTHF